MSAKKKCNKASTDHDDRAETIENSEVVVVFENRPEKSRQLVEMVDITFQFAVATSVPFNI